MVPGKKSRCAAFAFMGRLDVQLQVARLHAWVKLVSSNGSKSFYCLVSTYRKIHPNQCNCAIFVRFKYQIAPKDGWSSRAINGRHLDNPAAVTHWGMSDSWPPLAI
jgi:hypothetical protein